MQSFQRQLNLLTLPRESNIALQLLETMNERLPRSQGTSGVNWTETRCVDTGSDIMTIGGGGPRETGKPSAALRRHGAQAPKSAVNGQLCVFSPCSKPFFWDR